MGERPLIWALPHPNRHKSTSAEITLNIMVRTGLSPYAILCELPPKAYRYSLVSILDIIEYYEYFGLYILSF